MGALLAAAVLVAGCASASEREWQVAADPHATADQIIDAGHAADVATGADQMVVTWEVDPEDDEGPSQGAWRLYDRDKGNVADGTFGTVREANGSIDVVALRDGFLLTDYVKHRRHFLDRSGTLTPADLSTAKPGSYLAGGIIAESAPDRPGEPGWEVVLPDKRVVRLADLPTTQPQAVELTSDGTVWVLLPWTERGPFRIAHAKNGKAPWTTETIPLPRGSATDGEGISAHGDRLFVVASHERGDRLPVDTILARQTGEKGWERIDASGIADDLTSSPRVAVLPKGGLVASAGGEGVWVQDDDGEGFTALRPPGTNRHSSPTVQQEGLWLWASDQGSSNELHYSYSSGETWREFRR
ncbi:MAG TPA: hypothetical protein VJL80_12155 [Aeromicrobium sp.]|nr:hypothetical protein [Aeromicrobium sp.]HKY58783.1 hypothetical protein [Aeromicrobium sp.]